MEIKDTTEEPEEQKWRRIIIIVSAIVLLVLILSYFLASYPIFPIIASLSESKIAHNKTIALDQFSIIFTNNTYKEIQEYYHKDLSVEIVLCLKGDLNNNYIINEIYQPKILEQTVSHVRFEQCSPNTLILLHSQPFRHCIASKQDIITLNQLKQQNPNSIIVIMCEPNRFSIYR
jgi:hypothetical protein